MANPSALASRVSASRISASLLAAGAAVALLSGCGSDSSGGGGTSASTGGGAAAAAPAAKTGGDVDGPCDVTDQATVASVFTGAGAGKAGEVRNCEYSFASGPVQAVNIFYYEDTTLDQYRKQLVSNDLKFSAVSVGDGALRDQVHALVVQQGTVLFGVQALPRNGVAGDKLAAYDPQTLALAKKIAAGL